MILLRTYFFIKLSLLKILIFLTKGIRSAKDYDRMIFEWEMCKLGISNKKILYVGVHGRSYVYQWCFPFDFCDISDEYLRRQKSSQKKKFLVKDCADVDEYYDLVILSGILDYGTGVDGFLSILAKDNFKSFLVQDWYKNHELHTWAKHLKTVKINKTFYYYFHKSSLS